MEHLGDICTINGAEIALVDVITGGSPCQDLSVAGKRAGLAGKRSGLFMEQIRLIKEMRNADKQSGRTNKHIRPRYMVWENVPGAFSSNKGEDFRAVLEETSRIADGNADVPQPPNGKWSNAGCIMGDGWSIAWRVHDAQFWGVPQRRRRIALVADFGGQSAPEILFERKSVSGDFAESGTAGQGTAGGAESGVGATECYGIDAAIMTGGNCTAQGPCYYPDLCATLKAAAPHGVCKPSTAYAIRMREGCAGGGKGPLIDVAGSLAAEPGMKQQTFCIQGNCIDRADTAGCNGKGWTEDVSYTLNTIDRPAVFDAREPITYPGVGITSKTNASNPKPGDPCHTLNADSRNYVVTGDHQNRVTDYTAVVTFSFGRSDEMQESNVASTQSARQYKCATDLVAAVDCRNGTENPDVNGTLQAKEQGQNLNSNNVVRSNMTVRRLTPAECERLQGFPDRWTDIGDWQKASKRGKLITVKCSDSARYKALGNSIALPFWRWMLTRMSTHLPADATLGSLFDGIGGFPLIWEEIHGAGSAIWASEIEKFPIAVTKYHFGEGL